MASSVCPPPKISSPSVMDLLASSLQPSTLLLTKSGTSLPVYQYISPVCHHNILASNLSAGESQQDQLHALQFVGGRF
ncbi:hypothetical protein SLEP1_g20623 [Rubroshorea leprosula]|uniref:Uncharacterized protein n=1 Tax=Rubroshorea leprosula TaxID=152421 RepID=A0AAV5J9E5_9ROSI|nr:hypothetical protein SLEP1_g20623 [Rubroshorea leprosula]